MAAQRLLEEFAAGPGRVLIGGAAVGLLRGERVEDGPHPTHRRRHSRNGGGAGLGDRKRTGCELLWRIEDPRYRQSPACAGSPLGGGERRPEPAETVLDVYNAGAFEAIPFIELDSSPIKVGTPFGVLMRFRLIDMWTIQVLMELRATTSATPRRISMKCSRATKARPACSTRWCCPSRRGSRPGRPTSAGLKTQNSPWKEGGSREGEPLLTPVLPRRRLRMRPERVPPVRRRSAALFTRHQYDGRHSHHRRQD